MPQIPPPVPLITYGIMTEELFIREIRIDVAVGRGNSDSRMRSFDVIMPLKLQWNKMLIYGLWDHIQDLLHNTIYMHNTIWCFSYWITINKWKKSYKNILIAVHWPTSRLIVMCLALSFKVQHCTFSEWPALYTKFGSVNLYSERETILIIKLVICIITNKI